MRFGAFLSVAFWLVLAGSLSAQSVYLTEIKAKSTFSVNGQTFTIERNQDETATLTGDFAKTSRACPAFCIQPMEAAPGVTTVGELELIEFLENEVSTGRGLLIDARLPDFFVKGSIPSALNVPFSALSGENPYLKDILKALGATDGSDGNLNFDTALKLALFCNGPWCEQSRIAVKELINAGYPANKIIHYRGGMQSWLSLGLTTTTPN